MSEKRERNIRFSDTTLQRETQLYMVTKYFGLGVGRANPCGMDYESESNI